MARTPSMSADEAERILGPRGPGFTCTSDNRGTVKKWLVAKGLPSDFVGGLSLIELQLAYRDDQGLQKVRDKLARSREDVLGIVTSVNSDKLGGGSWSYGVPELERKWSGEALRRVLSPANELLFIPASYINDAHNKPEQWVRDMLRQYGMGAVDRDEGEVA